MAKNLVDGTNIAIVENGNDISLDITDNFKNYWEQKINNSFKQNNVYSTTETVVGTCLEKPLYRKVVFLNALPNTGTDVRYATGITTNIDIIKMYGKAINTNTNKTFTLPFVGTNFIGWIYDNATNEILITTTNDRSNMIGYAVLEYIKTNDRRKYGKSTIQKI